MKRSMLSISVSSCSLPTYLRAQTKTWPLVMGLWLIIAKTFLRMRKICVAGTLVTPKTISPDIFWDIIIINLSVWVTSKPTVQQRNIL